VGQEECPLSLTEDLPLFRIDSERIKKDCSHWKQGHSDSIPLVTSSSKKIDFWFEEEEIRYEMADIIQIKIEEMIRVYGEEEMVRMIKVIIENNVMMLKLQKQIVELQVAEEERKRKQRRRQEEREQERREYEERWEEEEQRS